MKNDVGPGRLEVAPERFVDALHDGRHRDDDEHAERDAHDRERGADLVGAERVEGDADALECLGGGGRRCAWSLLRAARRWGRGAAARRAGYTPEVMPTTVPSSVATTSDQGATAAGSGVVHEMIFAPSDAEPDAEDRAERAQRRALDEELAQDVLPPRAERLPHADLARPLGDGDEHDVHDHQPADHEADRRAAPCPRSS